MKSVLLQVGYMELPLVFDPIFASFTTFHIPFLKLNSLLSCYVLPAFCASRIKPVFRIRIHFFRIRIQRLRLETNTDTDPGSGSGFRIRIPIHWPD